jgi:hypothetical protein
MSYCNVAEQWVREPAKRAALFIDLAEETGAADEVRLSEQIGKLPCIAGYAPRSQGEILRALVARMRAPVWAGDRLVRVRGGVFRWENRQRPDLATSVKS